MEQRAEIVLCQPPRLIADVWLYPSETTGATRIKLPGWGCMCCRSKTDYVANQFSRRALFGYDGWPQLRESLAPGDRRRVGFVFLSSDEEAANEAIKELRKVGRFFLWDGGFIGEAEVVE